MGEPARRAPPAPAKINAVEAADRVLLIDVDRVVGPVDRRPDVVRARMGAVLRAAGPVHHAMACYASAGPGSDLLASVLAELGVSSRAVPPGRGAVELVLLAHARYAYGRGCRAFAVAAADDRFTVLGDLGRFEVVDWSGRSAARSVSTALATGVGIAVGQVAAERFFRALARGVRGRRRRR